MNGENNTHQRYEDLVDRALDGALSADESKELEHHLEDCPSCAEVVHVVRAAADAWREAPDAELPDGMRDAAGARLMDEIAGDSGAQQPTSERGKVSWLRVAAVAVPLAAAAAIALVLAWPDPHVEPSPGAPQLAEGPDTGAAEEPASPASEIAVPVHLAGRATVTAAGGKPVPISTDVRIRVGDVVTVEDGGELELELPQTARLHLASGAVARIEAPDTGIAIDLRRGELAALVEKREPEQTFEVHTPAGTVEVTGTLFRVRVTSTAEAAVEVVEGRVLVRDRADERNVIAVDAGRAMAFDWSAPETSPLAVEPRGQILALFDMEGVDAIGDESAAETGSASGKSKWERLFEEAQQLRKEKRMAEALTIYGKIADGAPSKAVRAEASFTMGQLRYSNGDSAGAAQDLQHHLELHGKSPYHEMALYYLAKSRMKLGRYGDALSSLRELTASHPKGARAAEAHYYTGTILAGRMNDCPSAIRSLDRFLAMAPSHKLAPKARELKERCTAAAVE
jgi:TolA-binding protein/anti-sigma factor RsiW